MKIKRFATTVFRWRPTYPYLDRHWQLCPSYDTDSQTILSVLFLSASCKGKERSLCLGDCLQLPNEPTNKNNKIKPQVRNGLMKPVGDVKRKLVGCHTCSLRMSCMLQTFWNWSRAASLNVSGEVWSPVSKSLQRSIAAAGFWWVDENRVDDKDDWQWYISNNEQQKSDDHFPPNSSAHVFGQSGRRENTEKHKHTLFNFVARQHKISLLLPPTVFISSSLSDSTALSASESVVALQLRPGTFYTTKAMSPSAAPKAANHRVCVCGGMFSKGQYCLSQLAAWRLCFTSQRRKEKERVKKKSESRAGAYRAKWRKRRKDPWPLSYCCYFFRPWARFGIDITVAMDRDQFSETQLGARVNCACGSDPGNTRIGLQFWWAQNRSTKRVFDHILLLFCLLENVLKPRRRKWWTIHAWRLKKKKKRSRPAPLWNYYLTGRVKGSLPNAVNCKFEINWFVASHKAREVHIDPLSPTCWRAAAAAQIDCCWTQQLLHPPYLTRYCNDPSNTEETNRYPKVNNNRVRCSEANLPGAYAITRFPGQQQTGKDDNFLLLLHELQTFVVLFLISRIGFVGCWYLGDNQKNRELMFPRQSGSFLNYYSHNSVQRPGDEAITIRKEKGENSWFNKTNWCLCRVIWLLFFLHLIHIDCVYRTGGSKPIVRIDQH